MQRKGIFAVAAALVFAAALSMAGSAKDGDKDKGKDVEKEKVVGVQELVVDFGRQNTPTANPLNHFIDFPNGRAVNEGGTVVFRLNQGGHGVSVYRVADNTIDEDIRAGLCPVRNSCNAAFIAADHIIMDGEGNIVAESGTNPPFARLDDAGRILVGTAAQVPGQDPGRFHQGTPVPPTPPATVGQSSERIRIKFLKKGRYLAICMNRNHSINDWMFGLFDVVEPENEQQ